MIKKSYLIALAVGLGLVLALVALLGGGLIARAAGPLYVAPDGNDSNSCLSASSPCATINGAIGKASPSDIIYVATGTYTVNTGSEVVLVDRNITLSGGWDSGFTTQSGMTTIDGDGLRVGMSVGATLAIVQRVIIQNGYAPSGGAGLDNDGTLTLITSIVDNNRGSVGAISNSGTLTLTNTIVSWNTWGNGIYNYFGGTVNLINTSVNGNGTGIENESGTLRLNNSLVSNNINNGIYHESGEVIITNSTISSNGGNGFSGGSGTVAFNNSTVVGNSATIGGGIYNYNPSATVTLRNTIVAGNTGGSAPDCSGNISSAGYTLIGNTLGCNFAQGSGDLINTDAKLGPLMGSPGYHPLSVNSPAIDAGDPVGCTDGSNPLTTDQRGAPRVGRCDIGAYEYTPPGPAASIAAIDGTPQHARPLTAFEVPLQALVLDNLGSPVGDAAVTFTGPTSGASGIFADTGTYTTIVQANEWGTATAPPFTANGLIGNYVVTATVGGVTTPASFSLGNFVWYVTPNGDDANDCLFPSTACATLSGPFTKSDYFPGDVVLVAAGSYTGSGAEVSLVNKDVNLLGGWNASFTTQSGMSTVDGQGARRGITLGDSVSVTIERFVVQNGSSNYGGGIYYSWYSSLIMDNSIVTGNMASGPGGGVYGDGYTTLTLINSSVMSNTASYAGGVGGYGTLILNNSTVSNNNGGGIYIASGGLTLNSTSVSRNITGSYTCGGGIYNDGGSMNINDSTITENTASGDGGGICSKGPMTVSNTSVSANTSGGEGGGISIRGIMTLTNSIVSSNTTGSRGGGIFAGDANINNSVVSGNTVSGTGYGGGGIYTTGAITITNSTVNYNTAPSYGGGIYQDGGYLNLNNATVSSNTALIGGALYKWSGTATLNNATITNNQAGGTGYYGGGLFNNIYYGTLTLQNTIVAGNTNSDTPDCYGTIDSAGYNLIGNTTGCDFSTSIGDLLNVNPLLFPLIGSLGYHPLLPRSPAIDAGNPAGCTDNLGNPLDTDQRGVARSGRCDIGAYEFDPNNNPINQVFLPMIHQSCSTGICGRITLNGDPAAGITLELYFFNDSLWSILATTTTNENGDYAFLDMPSLGTGQRYFVLYRNASGTPGRLWVWGTRTLTSYSVGSAVEIGNFDIADITLISPNDGVSVALPYTFSWTPRPATPLDTYEFDLYDLTDRDPYAYTDPPLGYVGSFTLNSLPPGFSPGVQYVWEIWVYSPDGGYGISYEARTVTFSNTGTASVVHPDSTCWPLKPQHALEDLSKR